MLVVLPLSSAFSFSLSSPLISSRFSCYFCILYFFFFSINPSSFPLSSPFFPPFSRFLSRFRSAYLEIYVCLMSDDHDWIRSGVLYVDVFMSTLMCCSISNQPKHSTRPPKKRDDAALEALEHLYMHIFVVWLFQQKIISTHSMNTLGVEGMDLDNGGIVCTNIGAWSC